MGIVRKTEEADLRKRYPLYIEIGLVVTLLLLIVAFRVEWRPKQEIQFVMEEQEVVQMEEIIQTKQEVKPPPPPRPPVPVEVPDETMLEEEDLNLDAALDINEAITNVPPPPPPPEEEEEPEPEVFVIVEEMPQLIGGMRALYECIRYPEIARKAGVEGRVVVQFVVDENGNVTNPQVLSGPGAGLNEEALRCVSQLKFKPGRQRGRPVRVRYTLPVVFRLQ
ncbi:energy transducer TonB [Rhodothermus profundi]|uniref:Outer membrane transport energization protein TonB n=1 Tax=Rhodothermus profundi TaxID=633813 RepID=A0A1M6XPY8_9BACT|nr:energy transducer TonB [Rhodothermus profundi]SHL07865.1 outer membrane transport energization protein TonB [Rhodothermus profundi]